MLQLESRYWEVSYYFFDVIFLWNPLISHDEVALPFSQAPNSFMSPVMYPAALQTLFPALLSGFCFIGFLSPLVSILTSTLFSMLMLWPFGKIQGGGGEESSLQCLLLIPVYSLYHILLLTTCYFGARKKILTLNTWFLCLHEHILSSCALGTLRCPSRFSCSHRFEHQKEPLSLVS